MKLIEIPFMNSEFGQEKEKKHKTDDGERRGNGPGNQDCSSSGEVRGRMHPCSPGAIDPNHRHRAGPYETKPGQPVEHAEDGSEAFMYGHDSNKNCNRFR